MITVDNNHHNNSMENNNYDSLSFTNSNSHSINNNNNNTNHNRYSPTTSKPSSNTKDNLSIITNNFIPYIQAMNPNYKELPFMNNSTSEDYLPLPHTKIHTNSPIYLPSLYYSMGFPRTVALMTLPIYNGLTKTINNNHYDDNELSPYSYYRVQSPMDRLQMLYGGDSF